MKKMIQNKLHAVCAAAVVSSAALLSPMAMAENCINPPVPSGYSNFGCLKEGLATVLQNHHAFGYINESGQVVIPAQYRYAGSFSEGLANIEKDGQWGFIDKTGKVVVPFQYKSVPTKIVNADGNSVIGRLHGTMPFQDGVAPVANGDRFGLINRTGTMVVPFVYENIEYGEDHMIKGLLSVQRDGKWGVINSKGTVLIPLKYESIQQSKVDNTITAKLNGKSYTFNAKGKPVQ